MPSVVPVDTLLTLPNRGRRGLREALRLATRGDWQTRALALSAAGLIAGRETRAMRLLFWLARRVPGWRTRFTSAAYACNFIQNGLADRSWPVRTAAALALGECPRAASVDPLQAILKSPYRAERIAAAAALVRCGGSPPASSILDGALPTPARIGDLTTSADFLALLASHHARVLASWRSVAGADAPTGDSPAAWAAFLAGQAAPSSYVGPQAEIDRYDASGETAYLLSKPFSPVNRANNARLLHAFTVVAEHLHVPLDGRILDLGGGSAWISELLSKFGYRVFTLDVSHPLLTVGRQRFARERLTPRFVAADMMRLPIATNSMDAAIVSDALHHVPGVPEVFREVYRVLADGGRFILSEPGEGHSETAKSRGEVDEYGVEEREIHLLEAIEYGRAAGFTEIRIVPVLAPILHMTAADLTQTMTTPADEWLMRGEDRRQIAFAPFVLQSVFDHPAIVFQKGRRPVDSRVPQRLAAEIRPRLERRGRRVTGTISLRNTGDTIWLGGRDETGAVLLGFHLLTRDHKLVHLDLWRAILPADVPPAGSVDVSVNFELPDGEAPYCLKVDPVAEGICWFEDAGSQPVYIDV
jgi:SAM-dependent methyltransferase